MELTAATFKPEMAEALKTYEKYVVSLTKTPDECETSLLSLVEKAIKVYQDRAPGLRHGIALDPSITVILSQTEGDRPLCAIYFNLYSPHTRKTPRPAREKTAPEV